MSVLPTNFRAQAETRVSRFKTLSRAALCGLVLFAAGLQSAEAATKIRLGVLGGNPVAALLAYDRGYFKDNGLEIELVQLSSGPAAIAATTSGSVDISFGDLFAWVAGLSNGFRNVKLVAPAGTPSYGSLLVSNESGIKKPADLAGKRIGAPGAPLFSTVNKLWLANNGVDSSSIKFVIIPPGGEGPALTSRSVDAVYAYNDLVALSVQATLPSLAIGVPTNEIPAGATATGYYGNTAFISAQPKAVEAFVAALRKGAKEYLALPDRNKAELFTKYNSLELPALLAKYHNFFEEFHPTPVQTGGIDVGATQKWVELGFKYGAFPKPVDIAPYIHVTATR
ncbi:ABC transporter substrate-binding protein [Ferrovibrio sp.]|uniref:ABC transporter substrate-binding protein n=1 Tax=Ferrovibrio sp. TaxID=1917215 RepID=UPI0035B14639